MTRREAALILGLRESAAEERIKEAHRRIMIANHPDSGKQRSTAQHRL
jgi:DnaJ family protein C protein 19